ncbi:MAG: glycosyltransferase family 4 protein [Acidobacteriota bacterium]|nr:glycosyltransferase family 4 protein [Acidobacteriota bacterium]
MTDYRKTSTILPSGTANQNLSDVAGARVAWLLPTIRSGPYWQPFLAEFARLFPRTTLFTGGWGGYLPGFEDAFRVRSLGRHHHLHIPFLEGTSPGYEGVNWASPVAFRELRRFRPDVIFVSAFGLWTLLALLYRGMSKSRVIVVLDGVSESTAYRHSLRLPLRRAMARRLDAAVCNSEVGCAYLRDDLLMDSSRVYHRRFYVPDVRTLRAGSDAEPAGSEPGLPSFLFSGRIIARKGWRCLLDAAHLLRQRGRGDFLVAMVGDGPEMPQLRQRVCELGLEANFAIAGSVPYCELGAYFAAASVLILPSLEDTWGMVVSEAMALGKAVLCSRAAGASELIRDGEEGYVFDPEDSAALAGQMEKLLSTPGLARAMGRQAALTMASQTPRLAALSVGEVAARVLRP